MAMIRDVALKCGYNSIDISRHRYLHFATDGEYQNDTANEFAQAEHADERTCKRVNLTFVTAAAKCVSDIARLASRRRYSYASSLDVS